MITNNFDFLSTFLSYGRHNQSDGLLDQSEWKAKGWFLLVFLATMWFCFLGKMLVVKVVFHAGDGAAKNDFMMSYPFAIVQIQIRCGKIFR